MIELLVNLIMLPLVLMIFAVCLFACIVKVIGVNGVVMIMKVMLMLVWIPLKMFLMIFGCLLCKPRRRRR